MLYGRGAERTTIDRLLRRLRLGHGGLLLIRGEAGIGKTALLDHTASAAGPGCTVLRCIGVESGAQVPFVALHQMLQAHLSRVDDLPAEQARALRRALGLEVSTASTATSPTVIGLALLTLFSEISVDGPVLCLVDDAQWLDRASLDAIVFARQRLHDADAVLLVIAVRDFEPVPAAVLDLAKFGTEMALAGLDSEAAGALLTDRAPVLDARMRERLLGEARGNPLALLELSRATVDVPQIDVAGSPIALPRTGERVQESLRDRAAGLPGASRTAILVAAADDSGQLSVVIAAARSLGAPVADLAAAERAGLVATTPTSIVFRHPLIRSVIYSDATVVERTAAHRALADVLDVEEQADRRAWHLAAAAVSPDPGVVAELEAAATRAHLRGGYAESAAAFERAARLTTDSEQRGRLLATAARSAREAGHLDRAAALAEQACVLTNDPVTLARLAQVRALNEFHGPVPSRAAELVVAAADTVRGDHPEMAAQLIIEAVRFGHYAGTPATMDRAIGLIGKLSLPPDHALTALLKASETLIRFRRGADLTDLPSLAAAVEAIELDRLGPTLGPLHVHAAALHLLADDPERAFDLSERMAGIARTHGLIGGLPHMLLVHTEAAIALGQLATAVAIGTEALRLAEQTGQRHAGASISGALAHAIAWSGDHDRCHQLAAVAAEHGTACHADADTAMATLAQCLLDAGMGRHGAALERWRAVEPDLLDHPVMISLAMPEWIEAAARTGDTGRVGGLLDRYESWVNHHQGPAGRAVAHRCRALLSTDDEALAQFEAALQLHRRTRRPLAQARTELAYGEWLRRARRPIAARAPLRAAFQRFDTAGAAPWAQRARAELRAAGEAVHAKPAHTLLRSLSAQELQVAQLAAAGRTNREIGADLFLSPRTVGYHLHKVYTKLDITSRHELAALGVARFTPQRG